MSMISPISGATLLTITSSPRRSVTTEAAHPWQPSHSDGEFSVAEVNDRNLSAVESDGTFELAVQQFLNDGADLAVGSRPRAHAVRRIENRRHASQELRPNGCPVSKLTVSRSSYVRHIEHRRKAKSSASIDISVNRSSHHFNLLNTNSLTWLRQIVKFAFVRASQECCECCGEGVGLHVIGIRAKRRMA